MSHQSGAIYGIQTPEDLRQRSFVSEGGCWHWRGSLDKYGRPKTWFPLFKTVTTLGPVICFFRTGKRKVGSQVWVTTCGAKDCVNPEHWKPTSRKILATKAANEPRNPFMKRVNFAKARRARSKIDMEKAQEIRVSPGPILELVREYGLSKSSIYRIRNGECWAPIVQTPFGEAA